MKALSEQQQTILNWIAQRGSVERDAPWHAFRFRGGPYKSLVVLRERGLIAFDDDVLKWRITAAGRDAATA